MKTSYIDQTLTAALSQDAKKNARKRLNHNFHQPSDKIQRFLNAIEPDSYIRPHRHINPPKDEIFILIRGKGLVIIFSDDGEIKECYLLDQGKGGYGVDVPAGLYHTIVSLEPGSVFYEVKEGPFNPATKKGFASWAPLENTEAAVTYLISLKEKARPVSQ